jgi:hypothetical protein
MRVRWWREEELMNQRLTWLLTTQGLLSAAYGFLQYKLISPTEGKSLSCLPADPHEIRALHYFGDGIAVIGLGSSVTSFVGILAAVWAQRILSSECQGFYLGVSPITTSMGQAVALLTPVLCAGAWVAAEVLIPLITAH